MEWRGTSLGAVATIRIHHVDQASAQRLLRQIVSESRRLETVFSLYRPDSVLCELNRQGVLVAPPAELSELLTLCDHFWRLTHGTFDPTVQPLWRCYADYFAMNDTTSDGPSAAKKKEALELVGWEKVRFDRDKVLLDPYARMIVGQVRWSDVHYGYRIGSRREVPERDHVGEPARV